MANRLEKDKDAIKVIIKKFFDQFITNNDNSTFDLEMYSYAIQNGELFDEISGELLDEDEGIFNDKDYKYLESLVEETIDPFIIKSIDLYFNPE